MAVVKVAKVDEIPSGTGTVVQAGGKELALFNLNGTFYAIDNKCTHVGGPLGEGKVDGNRVTCPWHGSIFNITTGEVLGPPARRPVGTYPTRIEGKDVVVTTPA